MKYIIFDMEWNQPSTKDEKVSELIHGEIIQIGFILLNEKMEILHKEEVNIKPICYRNMNKYVSALTGITQADIDNGTDFASAFGIMSSYFENNTVIMTWGDDDIPLLKDNLKFHKIQNAVLPPHYNLQRIYSAQIGSNERQTGLKTAMEHFGLTADIQAHDALNDAMMTVMIARLLDISKGIADYGKYSFIKNEKSSQQPWSVYKPAVLFCHDYNGKFDGLAAECRKVALSCPECKAEFYCTQLFRQGKQSFISMISCSIHKDYFVRFEMKENNIEVSLFETNEAFERIYKNRVKNKEKRLKYKEMYKKQKASKNSNGNR